ncbi:MAG: CBS domain-containing protein [Planctomycetota bacterium]|jgi:CBS domain-containing protein
MPLTARDVMTAEVITVTPSTPLAEFARICSEDRISGAPVVRVDGTLVGIVTKTDLVQRMLDDDPRLGAAGEPELPALGEDVRQVADIMQQEIFTCAPDAPVWELAERMSRHRVHRVLVLDDRDDLVGIVTSLDILGRYPRES